MCGTCLVSSVGYHVLTMLVSLDTVLDQQVFDAPADSFEEGIDDLGKLLDFVAQRLDHDSHRGPDNL